MRSEVLGFTVNWLAILNDVLGGFNAGTGMVLAFVLWYTVIDKLAKKTK